MGRRSRAARRTRDQVAADAHADQVAQRLGKMLLDGRTARRIPQRTAAGRAGISQGAWSDLEHGASATLGMWSRAAMAVDASLEAYIRGVSAADGPRDAAHLRNQELVLRTAAPGGWRGLAEELIDRIAATSRAADVLLHRPQSRPAVDEYCLAEVFDWLADLGGSLRDWQRRQDALERYAIARMRDDVLPRVSGVWLIRATARNRALAREHPLLLRSRFAGSGAAWLAALTRPDAPMPTAPALLWVSVDGARMYPARLG
jgi:transcriptional regulator with XRE-family HTH domain